MTSSTDLSRRRMLAASSGALAAAGLAGASRVVAQTTPSDTRSRVAIEAASSVRGVERCRQPDRAYADDDRNEAHRAWASVRSRPPSVFTSETILRRLTSRLSPIAMHGNFRLRECVSHER